jgi:hypothetical protein
VVSHPTFIVIEHLDQRFITFSCGFQKAYGAQEFIRALAEAYRAEGWECETFVNSGETVYQFLNRKSTEYRVFPILDRQYIYGKAVDRYVTGRHRVTEKTLRLMTWSAWLDWCEIYGLESEVEMHTAEDWEYKCTASE